MGRYGYGCRNAGPVAHHTHFGGVTVINGDDPSGIVNLGKTRKNIHTGFFEPYNFPKGWGQASNNYIQHIYSYSTLSNYSKAQHGQGNEFANTIGTHQ